MRKKKIETKYGTLYIPVVECYADCFELIRSDYFRRTEKNIDKIGIILLILKFDWLVWFRLCMKRDFFSPLKNRIYARLSTKRMIDLPVGTEVGYGLYTGHSMCMVINHTTIIGNNVNLSQFLNIGSNKGKSAIICDGVYIAPQCSLVEDVTIGFNSIIGAGAVVTRDVSPNTTYAGVPAKWISDNHTTGWHFYKYSNGKNSN